MTDEPKEYLVIRIPKPRHYERFIWGLLVIVLLGLVFWSPFKSFGTGGEDVSAAASVPQEKKVVEPEVVAKPEAAVAPVCADDEELKEGACVKKEVTSKLSGDFKLDIMGIDQQRPAGANYVKIKNVKYNIVNEKKDYNLLLKVKVAGPIDSPTSQEKVRGEFNLPLAAGKSFSSVVALNSGTWLPGDEVSVTFIVEDFDKGEVLLQRKAKFTLDK